MRIFRLYSLKDQTKLSLASAPTLRLCLRQGFGRQVCASAVKDPGTSTVPGTPALSMHLL